MDKKLIKPVICCLCAMIFVLTMNLFAQLELGDQYRQQSDELYQKSIAAYKTAKTQSGINISSITYRLAELYYSHGEFDKTVTELLPVYASTSTDISIAKLLAKAYYRAGEYTDATKIFSAIPETVTDDEIWYYYGQTCEKQNLYPRAKEMYTKITVRRESKYAQLSQERIDTINALAKTGTVAGLPPEIQQLIKSTPGQEKYPNAGAIVVLKNEEMEIFPDSTSILTVHSLVKVLNDRGKGYGEIQLDYDSTDEKVELIYARTIKPDGEVVTVGKKHIRDVSKYLNFPLYSNARVMIVSMPEVTDGCYIEYQAKWYVSRLIDGRQIVDHLGIQDSEPQLSRKLTITTPLNYEFNYKSYDPGYVKLNLNFKPIVKIQNNKKIYEWKFTDIPEIISEPAMPPYSEISAYLSISSFNDWQEIHRWWWPITEPKIVVNDEIKKQVKELIKDKKLVFDKTAAIYHWVASKIRYVGVEYGEAGYEPHLATEIFANKYGDCKDKTILLIAMLKEIGVPAYPVLIGTRGSWNLDAKFPDLVFNHAITLVKIDDKTIFLDPTAETCSFGDLPSSDQNRYVLVFSTIQAVIDRTPLLPAEQNSVKIKMEINIAKDKKITATREVLTIGNYDQGQRAWLKYTKPVLIKETLKNRVNSITPGGELVDYQISEFEDLTKPIRMFMQFRGPKFLIEAGDNSLVPSMGGVSATLVSREKRVYPIDLHPLSQSIQEVVLKLPPDLKIKFIPPEIKTDTKWVNYIHRYTAVDNQTLKYEEITTDKDLLVSIEEYPEYKKMYEELARETDKQVVLEKQ